MRGVLRGGVHRECYEVGVVRVCYDKVCYDRVCYDRVCYDMVCYVVAGGVMIGWL